MLFIGILIGIGLYLAFTLATRCFFRVEEGHLAVVTTFGAAMMAPGEAIESRRLRTFGPGLHRKLPWRRAIVVSTMEQNLDLSGEQGGQTAMAEDGTILRLDSILRYVPVEAALYEFVFGLRAPLEHITRLFTCLLRNEIANFRAPSDAAAVVASSSFDFSQAGSYALIRRERKLLNRHIEQFCRDRIGDRYGVRFNAVDLTDILPPDELAEALNSVINAHTDAEAHHFRAEGDCQQRLLSAEQGVKIARARALSVETEIRTIGKFLQELAKTGMLDLYVERRRAEVLSEARTVYLKEGA